MCLRLPDPMLVQETSNERGVNRAEAQGKQKGAPRWRPRAATGCRVRHRQASAATGPAGMTGGPGLRRAARGQPGTKPAGGERIGSASISEYCGPAVDAIAEQLV